MFVLGHAVLGTALVRRWVEPVPLGWIVFGTLLPDLIDKPLYYSLYFYSRWFGTGLHGAGLGLISGTRTIGHTALFLVAVLLLAALWRRHAAWGVAAGVASHLFLDNLGDAFGTRQPSDGPTTFDGLVFPLHGVHFPISSFGTVGDHVRSFARVYVLVGEALGLVILAWWLTARKRRRSAAGDIDKS